jgi:hypothetical protein
MKNPHRVARSPAKPPSRATYAKLAVIAASTTFVTAKLVDIALIGSGLAAAAGSVVFAGFMVMQGDHAPRVNGMQYLSVFAAPKGGVTKSPDSSAVAEGGQAQPGIDPSPLGAIPLSPTTKRDDYLLVSARADRAWVRVGSRLFPVHPGDVLPNLGKVDAIVWGGGHWTLVGDKGEPLLTSGDGLDAKNPKGASGKPLILEDGGE